MGKNKERARELAVGWWNLDIAKNSRNRGYAYCDSTPSHRIAKGQGYLCNPSRMSRRDPELVCEQCFNQFPYDPWDGGYSAMKPGPYKTVTEALSVLGKKSVEKKWWQFWKWGDRF